MPPKKVKISIKPLKLAGFIIVAIAVIVIIFFSRSDSKKITTDNAPINEIVLPRDTGVADSGFELKNAAVSGLNAKAIFDNLDEISGKLSLKIYFLEGANSSVKIGNYINEIGDNNFYRLSFWARTNADEEKTVEVSIAGANGSKNLGNFSFDGDAGARYFEFNFQAENSYSDIILTSTDGKLADVWIDDVLLERINIESAEQLQNLRPTIFGNTFRYNVDRSQTEESGNSENFFATSNRKMGQIFEPSEAIISGVTLKIQKKGTGGRGSYHLQIREYDENLGIIYDDIIATRNIYTDYPASFLDQIKAKEQEMSEEFDQRETDILEGRIPNDETVDWYPPDYTQQQINESKAQKRKDAFALAVAEMKEDFNVPYELYIPISAKLDTTKKYWIGIDSAGVKTDKRNYIIVFLGSESEESESESGFISKETGVWQEYNPLWFKTFYPKHAQVESENILSGATIADFGDKMIYRYQFSNDDYSALSGFPGRKIYDIYDSNFRQSDAFGNYNLSPDQYAVYKFNTVYPAKKIIIRNMSYSQSLAVNFSSDGENWREIFSNNPEIDNLKTGPLVFYPDNETNTFYLKIAPVGNSCVLTDLNLEAEL